jgi:hypothetical protein
LSVQKGGACQELRRKKANEEHARNKKQKNT